MLWELNVTTVIRLTTDITTYTILMEVLSAPGFFRVQLTAGSGIVGFGRTGPGTTGG